MKIPVNTIWNWIWSIYWNWSWNIDFFKILISIPKHVTFCNYV